jgi:hypothetical protein
VGEVESAHSWWSRFGYKGGSKSVIVRSRWYPTVSCRHTNGVIGPSRRGIRQVRNRLPVGYDSKGFGKEFVDRLNCWIHGSCGARCLSGAVDRKKWRTACLVGEVGEWNRQQLRQVSSLLLAFISRRKLSIRGKLE